MLSYRPPLESRKNFLASPGAQSFGFQSLMTRQSLYALLHALPQRNIILPRFVPGGVYRGVQESNKRIFYYDVPTSLHIDKNAIENFGLVPEETIFYYIHQFGLYVQESIDLMETMQGKGYFVVDDRSLSLPVSTYAEFADATAYSFYKLVGIPFGGQVRTKTDLSVMYKEPDDYHATLRKKMTANFRFYANPILSAVPAFPYRAYNKLFSKYVSYNCKLDSCLSESPTQLPSNIQRKLERVDFDRITDRRIEIASMLFSGLKPDVLLPLPFEAFTRQSMMGFPILVDDPVWLHKHLVRQGIFTTLFTKIWWWDPTRDYNDLYKRNIILPAHQRLSDRQVEYIIACVNKAVA
jgi:dTDP-4-amino-4,6-dideoxygalactose transaminase